MISRRLHTPTVGKWDNPYQLPQGTFMVYESRPSCMAALTEGSTPRFPSGGLRLLKRSYRPSSGLDLGECVVISNGKSFMWPMLKSTTYSSPFYWQAIIINGNRWNRERDLSGERTRRSRVWESKREIAKPRWMPDKEEKPDLRVLPIALTGCNLLRSEDYGDIETWLQFLNKDSNLDNRYIHR